MFDTLSKHSLWTLVSKEDPPSLMGICLGACKDAEGRRCELQKVQRDCVYECGQWVAGRKPLSEKDFPLSFLSSSLESSQGLLHWLSVRTNILEFWEWGQHWHEQAGLSQHLDPSRGSPGTGQVEFPGPDAWETSNLALGVYTHVRTHIHIKTK